jgi:coenzyme F420 biosynthesis associated uncharacterized protein
VRHDVAVIDWSVATQLGAFVSGDPGHRPRPGLEAAARESERLVSEYTRLVPASPLPPPELLTRPAWIQANLRSLRVLLDPLADRAGAGLGPLGPAMRGAVGLLLGAETGLLLGYVARRVLGQYELVLLDAQAPPRLLFVGPNLDEAAEAMRADEDELLRWVALHEVTHALQFGGVPWLRDHLAGLLRDLIDSLDVALDPARIMRMPARADLRALADAVASGDLLSFVAGPRQRDLLERLQAVMAVLEGHAEHVMDAVGEELLPSLGRLREGMTRRRRTQSPAARLLSRLLGLELKLRQYEQGKRFCDAVVESEGAAALDRLWASPEALPTPAELDDPAAWIARSGRFESAPAAR